MNGANNIVENSFYYDTCPKTVLLGTADGGAVTSDGIVTKFEVTELTSSTYTPKTPISLTFAWSDCIELPDILCE